MQSEWWVWTRDLEVKNFNFQAHRAAATYLPQQYQQQQPCNTSHHILLIHFFLVHIIIIICHHRTQYCLQHHYFVGSILSSLVSSSFLFILDLLLYSHPLVVISPLSPSHSIVSYHEILVSLLGFKLYVTIVGLLPAWSIQTCSLPCYDVTPPSGNDATASMPTPNPIDSKSFNKSTEWGNKRVDRTRIQCSYFLASAILGTYDCFAQRKDYEDNHGTVAIDCALLIDSFLHSDQKYSRAWWNCTNGWICGCFWSIWSPIGSDARDDEIPKFCIRGVVACTNLGYICRKVHMVRWNPKRNIHSSLCTTNKSHRPSWLSTACSDMSHFKKRSSCGGYDYHRVIIIIYFFTIYHW